MKYYLPIFLQNKNIKVLQINKNIKIRKITQKERVEFFGIKKIKFGFFHNELLVSKIYLSNTTKGRHDYREWEMKHIVDQAFDIFASNYVVEVKNDNNIDKIARNLNLSFNISKPTNTRCYLKFEHDVTNDMVLPGFEKPFTSLGYLNLTKRGLKDLPIIYKKIKDLNKKEKLKFELFMDGLHNQVSVELRFLSLVMALENMFLPDCNTELRLRFSLRIAKIINEKITKKDKKGVFELAVKIYDIRSKIVHNGCSKKLTNAVYAQTVNLVWVSLVEYINYPKKFKEQYLKDVLL